MAPRGSCRVQTPVFDPKEKLKESNRALLVGIQLPGMPPGEGAELLGELEELCNTASIEIVRTELVRLRGPGPRYLVGAGKARELMDNAKECGAALIIFDEDLSPAQQRNWEEDSDLAVIDRQEVILEVFAQRASTRALFAIIQGAFDRNTIAIGHRHENRPSSKARVKRRRICHARCERMVARRPNHIGHGDGQAEVVAPGLRYDNPPWRRRLSVWGRRPGVRHSRRQQHHEHQPRSRGSFFTFHRQLPPSDTHCVALLLARR